MELLGDGHQLGIRLQYCEQPRSNGLAQAFLLGEKIIGMDPVAMVLNDNIFVSLGLKSKLTRTVKCAKAGEGATMLGFQVPDPERFGDIGFDADGCITSLSEKPEHPESNWCVTGLYVYDNNVVEYVKITKGSPRGELEITDLIASILKKESCAVSCVENTIT